MKKKKFLKIFDYRPKYLGHLFLIVSLLFFGFYVGDKYLNLSEISPISQFIFWFIVLYFSDSISEYILGV